MASAHELGSFLSVLDERDIFHALMNDELVADEFVINLQR